jgi:hypothetical protein
LLTNADHWMGCSRPDRRHHLLAGRNQVRCCLPASPMCHSQRLWAGTGAHQPRWTLEGRLAY